MKLGMSELGQANSAGLASRVRGELGHRSAFELGRNWLEVDYYRIRYKLAVPLPVKSLGHPFLSLGSRYETREYPWHFWFLLRLAERVEALGWARQFLGDEAAGGAVCADLRAMASWGSYRSIGGEEFGVADHAVALSARCLSLAVHCWEWLDDGTRDLVRGALGSLVNEQAEHLFAVSYHGPHADMLPEHNIPLTAAIGAAMAARVGGHSDAAALEQKIHEVAIGWLDARRSGYSEDIGYDGYVHYFLCSWLEVLGPGPVRDAIVGHDQFGRLLDESILLGAPGEILQVAELSDTEQEMSFHAAAHAWHLSAAPGPRLLWYLDQCDLSRMPVFGLAMLAGGLAHGSAAHGLPGWREEAGALDAQYALALRSGWEANDLAVAVSCSECPCHHIQEDSGSLVIGSQGHWLIDDPGYRQYLDTSERPFTTGPEAHNAPLIAGRPPEFKRARRLALESGEGRSYAAVDLAACYAEKPSRAIRHVWLLGSEHVVVADEVEVGGGSRLQWFWHGNRDAAWWVEDNWAVLRTDRGHLQFTCPTISLHGGLVVRKRGSRGHLTLGAETASDAGVTWWVFTTAERRPHMRVVGQGASLEFDGFTLSVLAGRGR
jgi:hypothetical protein